MGTPATPSGGVARVGAGLAVGVSAGLLVMVLARDVGVNVLTAWTIVLGAAGGVVAWRGQGRRSRLWAIAIIIVGALPATVFVGLGLVYLIPVVLIAVGGESAPAVPRPPRHTRRMTVTTLP